MQINKRQTRQPDTTGKLLEGPLAGPQVKSGPVIPSHCGHVSPGKLKTPEPSVKDHTIIDDGKNMENKSKVLIGNGKCIFWQTSINDQGPRLIVLVL